MNLHDPVNHPRHYNNSAARCECGRRIECIDVTRHMGFNIGNAVKYLWRFLDKGGLEDLKKALWYLEDQIKQMPPPIVEKEMSHACDAEVVYGKYPRCEQIDKDYK